MDREELAALVRQTGCVLRGAPGEFDCPDLAAKVKLLDLATTHDARYDPRVRRLAVQIARTAPTTSAGDLSRALHVAVKRRVRYLGEAIDTFQSAWQTWELGLGDCDDSARLLAALARSLGLRAELVVLRDKQGSAAHVAAALEDSDGQLRWAETTLDAAYGEHPVAALVRLTAAGRRGVIESVADVGNVVQSTVDDAAATIDYTPLALVVAVGLAIVAYAACSER